MKWFNRIIIVNKTDQITYRMWFKYRNSFSVPYVLPFIMNRGPRENDIHTCSILIHLQRSYWCDIWLSVRRQEHFCYYHNDYMGKDVRYESSVKAKRENVTFRLQCLPLWLPSKISYGVAKTLHIASHLIFVIHSRHWLLSYDPSAFFIKCLTLRRRWMLTVAHAVLAAWLDPCTWTKSVVDWQLHATYLSIARHHLDLVLMTSVMVPYRQMPCPRQDAVI